MRKQITYVDRYNPVQPGEILRHVNQSHRGHQIVRAFAKDPNKAFPKAELMAIGRFSASEQGNAVSAATAFYWWIERVNDRLPRLGWYIAQVGSHFTLTRISRAEEELLTSRLNGSAA